jgi:hypothetical protein
MGFITDNTNTVEVYLTDLGRQVFLQGGLQNAVKFFSVCDGDSNYHVFMPDTTDILSYDSTILATYVPGDIVLYGTKYYRFKVGTGSRTDPSLLNWWEEILVFNPTIISPQPIAPIDNMDVKKTSLGAGTDESIGDVFTQVALRGSIVNNKVGKRVLAATKNNTLRSYVMREPDLGANTVLTTYIVV